MHEDALVGLQVKAGYVLGSFDPSRYVASPSGANELDFEEDLFGAVRVLDRGQIALLVPIVETWRRSETFGTSGGGVEQSGAGGGVGDVNVSARYDLTIAGSSLIVPGVAALVGFTVPTGKPPEAAGAGSLEANATDLGVYQINAGLAIENAFGPWLVNATAVLAVRTARTVGTGVNAVHERLAPQWTFLLAVAYAFPNDWAAALSASYAAEGDATINGAEALLSSRRLPTLSLSGVMPLSDTWRVQCALFDNPPISSVGFGQPADAGLSLTMIRSWL
ncbi:MAG: hypothetical protein ABSC94_17725 [Polyangiaceae bacterium]